MAKKVRQIQNLPQCVLSGPDVIMQKKCNVQMKGYISNTTTAIEISLCNFAHHYLYCCKDCDVATDILLFTKIRGHGYGIHSYLTMQAHQTYSQSGD